MRSLADMVIDEAVFLATASNSEIAPGVAVARLETLVFAASELSADDREALRTSIRSRVHTASDHQRSALVELEENLGLA